MKAPPAPRPPGPETPNAPPAVGAGRGDRFSAWRWEVLTQGPPCVASRPAPDLSPCLDTRSASRPPELGSRTRPSGGRVGLTQRIACVRPRVRPVAERPKKQKSRVRTPTVGTRLPTSGTQDGKRAPIRQDLLRTWPIGGYRFPRALPIFLRPLRSKEPHHVRYACRLLRPAR